MIFYFDYDQQVPMAQIKEELIIKAEVIVTQLCEFKISSKEEDKLKPEIDHQLCVLFQEEMETHMLTFYATTTKSVVIKSICFRSCLSSLL